MGGRAVLGGRVRKWFGAFRPFSRPGDREEAFLGDVPEPGQLSGNAYAHPIRHNASVIVGAKRPPSLMGYGGMMRA